MPTTSHRTIRAGAPRFAALALAAARRSPTHGAATRGIARQHNRPSVDRPTGSPASITPGARPTTNATGAGTADAVPGVSSRVSGATGDVAGAVGNTTQVAADAVAPVAPPAAGALTQIGAAGSTVVSGAGQAVGKAVDSLLPPP